MEIGTIIKKYRRQRDMNQEALAEYLRVSVSAVSQWESGKTAPDLALIPAICNLFAIRDKQLALYDILIEDGNYGFYHNRMDNIHRGQAKYYAEIGDAERTLHHLSAAADHAITFVVTEGECEYTSLLLRGQSAGTFSTSSPVNDAQDLINFMSSPAFDFLRDTPAFTAILEKLAPVAGQWKIKE